MTATTMDMTATTTPNQYPCPHCKKPTAWADNPYKPFCSERCKLIDFGAWANESYALASEEMPLSDGFFPDK